MKTKQEIIDLTFPLIQQLEGFIEVAKWDNKQWTNGYGTKALVPYERITKEVAKQRMLDYLDAEYDKLISYLPAMNGDLLSVPLLSKGYQYGSGLFKSYKNLTPEEIIHEAFYLNEEYPQRRKAEIEYYYKLMQEEIHNNPSLAFAFVVILLGVLGIIIVKYK